MTTQSDIYESESPNALKDASTRMSDTFKHVTTAIKKQLLLDFNDPRSNKTFEEFIDEADGSCEIIIIDKATKKYHLLAYPKIHTASGTITGQIGPNTYPIKVVSITIDDLTKSLLCITNDVHAKDIPPHHIGDNPITDASYGDGEIMPTFPETEEGKPVKFIRRPNAMLIVGNHSILH